MLDAMKHHEKQRPSQARGDTTNCDFPEVHVAQGVHDGQRHTKHHLHVI